MNEDAPPADPWLTVAEIADELRVNPATVRLWISKGLLPAKRAGRRKLLVRRSDLDEMLLAEEQAEADPAPAEPGRPPSEGGRPLASVSRIGSAGGSSTSTAEDPLAAVRLMQASDEAWGQAVDASQFAPPDANFPHRIRALALAAAGESRAMVSAAANSRMRWRPTNEARGIAISHELRPGGNRPGPPPLWAEFDRCVERIGIAMESPDLAVIAARWQDLAEIMHELADALLDQAPKARDGR
jgi:excisionase family DNA binding protein